MAPEEESGPLLSVQVGNAQVAIQRARLLDVMNPVELDNGKNKL